MSKVVVLSLGQIADSDIETSYDTFSRILEEQRT